MLIIRGLKPAVIRGGPVPGLRSLRSLTRGYHLPSLRDSLDAYIGVDTLLSRIAGEQHNKSLDASGGSVNARMEDEGGRMN
ncbi:MAG TPA: hypothetical protein VFH31_00665 [Pyrinomonadaceae bacterium]|nr:hypothetical protein [Pyrinomonadaceae bacterium]